MKTSDKELDDLFVSKLDSFEVEPSVNLWQNIDLQLDKKAEKKSVVPALRIAASLIIILSVGLILLQKHEPVKNKTDKKIVKVELQKSQSAKTEIVKSDDKNSMLLLSAKNKATKTASFKTKIKVITDKHFIPAKPRVEENTIETLAQLKPKLTEENPKIKPTQSQMALVPDASISLKPQHETEILPQTILKPQVIVLATNPPKPKRKRIRSIGDVVNLVMAKVDKREDKLIQFSDSDDGDESNVTGINLGIINLKKENK